MTRRGAGLRPKDEKSSRKALGKVSGSMKKPTALIILDGYGIAKDKKQSAIDAAADASDG